MDWVPFTANEARKLFPSDHVVIRAGNGKLHVGRVMSVEDRCVWLENGNNHYQAYYGLNNQARMAKFELPAEPLARVKDDPALPIA